MKTNYIFLCFCVLGIEFSYAQAITSGLMAYYPFNGNFLDLSGNSYNGASIGTESLTAAPDRFNVINKSMNFNADSRLVLNGLNDFSSKIQGQWTISLWIKSNQYHNNIISSYSSSFDELRFFSTNIFQIGYRKTVNNGAFYFKYKENLYSTTYVNLAIDPLLQNKWYLITISRNENGLVSFYLNENKLGAFIINQLGIYFDSQTTINENINTRYIASPLPSLQNIGLFSGVIDDVYIFNRALSDSEVNTLRGDYFAKSVVYSLENQSTIPKGTPLKVNFKATSN